MGRERHGKFLRPITGGPEVGISRPQLIAVLYLLGSLNGFAPGILPSIRAQGLSEALGWISE